MAKVKTCITGIRLNERTYHDVSIEPTLINFFYGGNGAGKSTIARAIKAKDGLTWDAESSAETRLMVFNEDYIKDNIQSYGNIPGVFTLTEEDATVRKSLDEKTKAKSDAEISLKKEEGKASDLVNYELSLVDKYAAKVWSQTETWRKTDFPKAVIGYGNNKKKFFTELYSRPRTQGDYSALQSTYAAVFDTEPVRYTPYALIDYKCLPQSDLLQKPIISRSDTEFAKFVRALGNLDWVRHGHDNYMRDERCPFCQRQMDVAAFEEGLASCYDDQYRKEIADLAAFVDQYKSTLNKLYTVIKGNQDNPFPLTDMDKQGYQHEFDMFMEKAHANVALLEQKQKEPSIELYEFEDLSPYLHKISDMIESINSSISDYMKLVSDPRKKDKAGKDIWSFMAYECRGLFEDYDREKSRLETEKKKNGEDIVALRDSIRELKDEIDELNNYTANTTQVMENINNTLRAIGFKGFLLREKPDTSYIYELVRVNEDGVAVDIARDLSEGERNFIAFLYFYHTVMGSQTRDGRITDKIVVIDDPVSSMDHYTQFYVATLTRELIEVCRNNYELEETIDKHIRQFFCLTHNPLFFSEITYDRLAQYECVSVFEITKDEANHSHVEPCEEDRNETGGGKINRSPVRNYYDSLWHVFRTTESKEVLMTTARQILDFHFLQNDGYKSTKFRELLFAGKNKSEFVRNSDDTYYRIAESMVALLSVGVSNFNDGLFFDTSSYTLQQMKDAFRIIFEVMNRTQHYNLKMGIDQ